MNYATIRSGLFLAAALAAGSAFAHCDTLNGPVIPEAKAAAPRGVAGEQPVAGYLNGHMN